MGFVCDVPTFYLVSRLPTKDKMYEQTLHLITQNFKIAFLVLISRSAIGVISRIRQKGNNQSNFKTKKNICQFLLAMLNERVLSLLILLVNQRENSYGYSIIIIRIINHIEFSYKLLEF